MNRNELARFGGTVLGVEAAKRRVFTTKDNYARRERLVREWAEEQYGEYALGAYHACNGIRKTRSSRDYLRGYNEARKQLN